VRRRRLTRPGGRGRARRSGRNRHDHRGGQRSCAAARGPVSTPISGRHWAGASGRCGWAKFVIRRQATSCNAPVPSPCHCLPRTAARRSTPESHRRPGVGRVDQAENRLHTAKAVLEGFALIMNECVAPQETKRENEGGAPATDSNCSPSGGRAAERGGCRRSPPTAAPRRRGLRTWRVGAYKVRRNGTSSTRCRRTVPVRARARRRWLRGLCRLRRGCRDVGKRDRSTPRRLRRDGCLGGRRAGMDGIAGTVAGDDTILVVCRQGVAGRTVNSAAPAGRARNQELHNSRGGTRERAGVLAYSGGLDTTGGVAWLIERPRVIPSRDVARLGDPAALAADRGAARAPSTPSWGRQGGVRDRYLRPTLQANARYQGKYPWFRTVPPHL